MQNSIGGAPEAMSAQRNDKTRSRLESSRENEARGGKIDSEFIVLIRAMIYLTGLNLLAALSTLSRAYSIMVRSH